MVCGEKDGLLIRGEVNCGGSLINSRWVLTVRACVVKNDVYYDMVAILGDHESSTVGNEYSGFWCLWPYTVGWAEK